MSIRKKGEDYLASRTYIGYILRRLRRGELWHAFSNIFRHIRKLTFFSALVRYVTILFAVIEKSAFLLLFFSTLVIILPAAGVGIVISAFASAVKYALNHEKIKAWLKDADKIFLYLTDCKNLTHTLVLRDAKKLADNENFRVIVLCNEGFVSFRRCSENLLKVKSDYFFVVKALYLKKCKEKLVYVSLI